MSEAVKAKLAAYKKKGRKGGHKKGHKGGHKGASLKALAARVTRCEHGLKAVSTVVVQHDRQIAALNKGLGALLGKRFAGGGHKQLGAG